MGSSILTCKNGHGPMQAQSHAGSDWFGVQSVKRDGSFSVNPAVILRLYRCDSCGYIELQDVPQDEFDASVGDDSRRGGENG